MFHLPDAKRVRREDLDNSAGDSWSDGSVETPDADLKARLNKQIARSLGLDTGEAGQAAAHPALHEHDDNDNDDDDDDDGVGEFEFRLFSSGPPARVTLQDESATPGGGALAYPRPPSFYAASNVPETLKSEYRFAAVSGEDVILRSRRPRWGMAFPWKVVSGISIGIGRRAGAGEVSALGEGRSRKRPGKKKRTADRKKAKVEEKRAMDKEEHLKEKKKRMNRLKKLRKRAKSKEGKTAGKDDGGGGSDDDGGSGDE